MKHIVYLVSGEWLFDSGKIANGGVVIVTRALFSSTLLFVLLMAVAASLPLDPLTLLEPRAEAILRSEDFVKRFMRVSRELFQWFGAMFAALYAALYSRFASQWAYLAGLYNQIKQAEARKEGDLAKLCDWKAGFLEDAEELHLATKPLFASVIVAWADDPGVETAYLRNTRGGLERFHALLGRARRVHLGGGSDTYHALRRRDDRLRDLSNQLDAMDRRLQSEIKVVREEVQRLSSELAALNTSRGGQP